MVDSAVLMSENTGVMPLPPANATMSPVAESRQKRPAGRVDSTTSPADNASVNHVETTPSSTRLTLTCSSSTTSGNEDMEYDRRCRSPLIGTRKVRNWPAAYPYAACRSSGTSRTTETVSLVSRTTRRTRNGWNP